MMAPLRTSPEPQDSDDDHDSMCDCDDLVTTTESINQLEDRECIISDLRYGRTFACRADPSNLRVIYDGTSKIVMCTRHYELYRNHQCCLCGYYTEFGFYATCPENHSFHFPCIATFVPQFRRGLSLRPAVIRCTHCNRGNSSIAHKGPKTPPNNDADDEMLNCLQQMAQEPSVDVMRKLNDYLANVRDMARRNKDLVPLLRTCLLSGVTSSATDIDRLLEALVSLSLNRSPAPLGTVEETADEVLKIAVTRGRAKIVECIRESVGASIYWTLDLLPEEKASEILKALQMDSEYGELLLLTKTPDVVGGRGDEMEVDETTTVLQRMATQGRWKAVEAILSHFAAVPLPQHLISVLREAQPPVSVCNQLQDASMLRYYSRSNVVCQDLSGGRERFPVRVVNDVDKEELEKLVYTTRVVDGEGILEQREGKAVLFCDCDSTCDSSCACWSGAYDVEDEQRDGNDNSTNWKNKRIKSDALRLPVAECNSACSCSLHCGNRVAQKGGTYPVEVFRSNDGRGWGLRTLCQIPRGAFIMEYTGELIGDEEADQREDKYLFETVIGSDKFTIDSHYVGNAARFINHSCEPNAKVGMVSWEPHEAAFSHVCVFAARHIQRGEEITFHYGHSWWTANIQHFPCLCGAPMCKYGPAARQAFIDHGIFPADPSEETPDEVPP